MATTPLEDLTREVAENKEVMSSAATLLQGLSAKIRENAANEQAMIQLATDLDTGSNTLAQAIVDNTPAATQE